MSRERLPAAMSTMLGYTCPALLKCETCTGKLDMCGSPAVATCANASAPTVEPNCPTPLPIMDGPATGGSTKTAAATTATLSSTLTILAAAAMVVATL
jgi:hypothetical protein